MLPLCPLQLFFDAGDEQVIAPFLITLRIAKQRALTSGSIISGTGRSIEFRHEQSTNSSFTLPGGDSLSSTDPNGGISSEPVLGASGIETIIEEVPS